MVLAGKKSVTGVTSQNVTVQPDFDLQCQASVDQKQAASDSVLADAKPRLRCAGPDGDAGATVARAASTLSRPDPILSRI